MTESNLRFVKMRLDCSDRIQFTLSFAPKLKSRVFVPMNDPPPVGTRVTLHISFSDGVVHVKGVAEVLKVVDTPKHGVHVRYVSLDADSIQFPLHKPDAPHAEGTTSGEVVLPFTQSGEFRVHVPGAPPATEKTAPAAAHVPAASSSPRASAPPPVPARSPAAPPAVVAAPAPSAPRPAPSAPSPAAPSPVASVLNPPPSAPRPASPPAASPPVAPSPAASAPHSPAPAPEAAPVTAASPAHPAAPAPEVTRVERVHGERVDVTGLGRPAPPARRDSPSDEEDDAPPPGLRRSRWPLAVAALVALVVLGGGAFFALKSPPPAPADDAALKGLLQKADERLAKKVYAAPGGDSALDLVRVALKVAPKDPEVLKRQAQLAEHFEAQAKAAEAANDYAEAAVQLQALVLLDPQRPGVQKRLDSAEDIVRNRTAMAR